MAIAIIGAGIGGLVAALSLERVGFTDVRVYERVRELRPLGVGINLLPHAVRELTELGLRDSIESIASLPRRLAYFNRYGQPIWDEPRGIEAGYQWPQLSVHRGRLQMSLLDAVRERLGPDAVRGGHTLTGVESRGGDVVARFDVEGAASEVRADLLVGADGIHSAVRRLWHPSEGEPIWNGLTLWRGTADVPRFLDGSTMIMVGDDELKFVAYPLGVNDDGSIKVNLIAEQRSDGTRSQTADWNRRVPAQPVANLFDEWRFDWLDVPATILAADEILEYPMVDRNALPSWISESTALLGDAAHAMYPNGSNGASQAILDARTLAYCLATAPNPQAALTSYDHARRPAMTQLLGLTRQQGPERVMVLARQRAPYGFHHIHDVIPPDELDSIANGYKQAAGFVPEALNARPSLTVPRRDRGF